MEPVGTPEIGNTLDALNLFLVFITVLFGVRYPEAAQILEAPLPATERKKERERVAKQIQVFIWAKWAPLVAVAGLGTYIFTPLTLAIVFSSSFSLWRFDVIPTAYCLIHALLGVWFGWTASVARRLMTKRAECLRSIESNRAASAN